MKVAEFRKDLSTCLDRAVQGETITIERAGQTFYLQLGPITHVAKANDKPYVMNGVDPLKRYDATTEEQAPADLTAPKVVIGIKHAGPVKGGMFDRDIQFCKHNNVKGSCKLGCK